MAKKTVATLHEGSKDGRAYTKVIKMVKSPKIMINLRLQCLVAALFFCNSEAEPRSYSRSKKPKKFWLFAHLFVTLQA